MLECQIDGNIYITVCANTWQRIKFKSQFTRVFNMYFWIFMGITLILSGPKPTEKTDKDVGNDDILDDSTFQIPEDYVEDPER